MTTGSKIDVCDDCLLVAYDKGIGVVHEWKYDDLDEFDKAETSGYQKQVDFMLQAGDLVEDHTCSAKIEPDLDCYCGCR